MGGTMTSETLSEGGEFGETVTTEATIGSSIEGCNSWVALGMVVAPGTVTAAPQWLQNFA